MSVLYRIKSSQSVNKASRLDPSAFINKPYVRVCVDGGPPLVLPEVELLLFFSTLNSQNKGFGRTIELKLSFLQMTDFDYFQLPECDGY